MNPWTSLNTRLQNHPRTSRVWGWAKLIGMTGSAQVVVQALSFVSGILVIRLLPVEEYALYTLANTILGMMTLLADGGISTGVMAQGGKFWKNKKKLGAVLRTGMELRKRFAAIGLIIATPILFYLLNKQNVSNLASTLIILSLIPAFIANLSSKLLEIPPKLKQDILHLQRVHVGLNTWRLLLNGLFLFAFPYAGFALLASGLAQIWANWRLNKLSSHHADLTQPETEEIRTEILGVVKKTLPTALFFSFSGQINILILTLFSTTQAIAEIGALGRLVILISIFKVLFDTLVTPRFSRLTKNRSIVLKRFCQVQLCLWVLAGIIISLGTLFHDELLIVLGPSYTHLRNELTLLLVSTMLGFINQGLLMLNLSRAFIVSPSILIPTRISILVLGIILIQPTTLIGVIYFGIFRSAFGPIIQNICFAYFYIRKKL